MPEKVNEKLARDFESFISELSAHVRVVGGVGDPERIKRMTIEEAYKEFHPNSIILGFRNMRMIGEYQLSYQMKGGI
jgi:hypothetical protein